MEIYMEANNSEFKFVIDENGYKHTLVKKIGQGGQGAVFSTMDENVVVKVLLDNEGEVLENVKRYKKFKSDINDVRILNLDKSYKIAKPISLLKEPYCGYIMRLLTGMQPLKKLVLTQNNNLKEFYINTGGLRRRLEILINLSKTLLRLHSLPIVYADMSLENVFVSNEVSEKEVWLIDCDNMRYTVDFNNPVYTPGYGAPEVVKGTGSNNTLSDVYSFAIIAFELLCLIPPFYGRMLTEESEDDDWEEEDNIYDKAEKGDIPWIDDIEDDRNRTEEGMPRGIILSAKVKEMFQQTLGYNGRKIPTTRPSMRKWYEVLKNARNNTIKCSKCGWTYYRNLNQCPACDSNNKSLIVKVVDFYNLDNTLKELNDEGLIKNIEKNEISKISRRSFSIKTLDLDGENQYIFNDDIQETLINDEVIKSILIKYDGGFYIKNLMDSEIVIKNKANFSKLMKNQSINLESLDGVLFIIKQDSTKIRWIEFKIG